MKRKILKSIIMFGIIVLINVSWNTISEAKLSLTASKSTVAPGETFNVTVSVSDNEAGEATLNANNGSLSANSADLMSQSSVSLTCTAGDSGTVTINASGKVANYDTETEEDQTASLTVNIESQTPDPEPDPEPTPDPEPAKSSDTSLASLSISPFGVIGLASTGIYDITVDNSLESVTITGVANDPNATIVSGNGTYDLEEGTNSFAVVVRAEDGSEESHRIRIIRKTAGTVDETTPPNVIDETNDPNNNEEENSEDEDKEDENSNGFGLSNLVITGLELNPTFATDVYEYKAEFSEDLDTLEVIATANQENAKVEIVGNTNLQIGENLITVIVTSEDGETTMNYQITVTKHEPEAVAASTTDETPTANQELKNQVGKIILIAVAAIITVIIIGIIVIINTRKRAENDFGNADDTLSKKVKKGDFRVAVDEDESYKELEKLSNIHNNKNGIFDTKSSTLNTENNIENSNIAESNENKEEISSSESIRENTGIFGEKTNNKVNDDIEKNNIFGNSNIGNSENITNIETQESPKGNDIFGNTNKQENKYNDVFTNNNENPAKPSISDIWDNDDTDNRGGRSSKGKRFK